MAHYEVLEQTTSDAYIAGLEKEPSASDLDRLISKQEVQQIQEDELLAGRGGKSQLRKTIERAFDLDYQSHHAGHEGKVTCVDGSDGMDWILSGGEDGTVRLWHYCEAEFLCYRLARHWRQGKTITSVAFAGVQGPVIAVTEDGELLVMGIAHHTVGKHVLEQGKYVVDLRVKRESYKDGDGFLLVTAAGTRAYVVETFPERNGERVKRGGMTDDEWSRVITGGSFGCETLYTYEHDGDVELTVHVPGAPKEGAAIATLCEGKIQLWTLDGQVMQTLFLPHKDSELGEIKCLENFDMSTGSEKGWVAGATKHRLYLWPLAQGVVLMQEGQKTWVADYQVNAGIDDVMMDPENQFFMVQRKDASFQTTKIVPEPDEDVDAISVSGHGLRLKKPEDILATDINVIKSTVKSQEMCLRYDDETGSVALCGFDDGSIVIYDLDGIDKGEAMSVIRTLSPVEVMLPFILRFVSFVQVFTYAFGPQTKYTDHIERPAEITSNIAMFDVDVALKINPADFFLPAVYVVFGTLGLFLILAVTGAPEIVADAVNALMRSEMYEREGREGWRFGPAQMCTQLATLMQTGLALMISLCSSILVVPMSKKMAQVVDCEHPEKGPPFLAAAPSILCGHAEQQKLKHIAAVLFGVYLIVVIPFAFVSGDATYMSRAELFRPWVWHKQAKRKATVAYLGSLHPVASSVVCTKLVELVTRVSLPCIVILTTHSPLLQTIGVSACGLISYLNSLLNPPLADQSWCAVEQGLQLFTLLCMCCGILSVLYPGAGLADGMLALSTLIWLISTWTQIRSITRKLEQRRLRAVETEAE